jgi:glucose-1-phosphate thymidylyltransferase
MTRFVGLLPAAGAGIRLPSLTQPKELLPVLYLRDPNTGSDSPVVAAEYALHAMRLAQITRCYIVIGDSKLELVCWLRDGASLGLSLAYLHQPCPNSLAYSLDFATPWLDTSYVCLALPDTVFLSWDALSLLQAAALQQPSDLLLGVFPTTQPTRLAPVQLTPNGKVLAVFEKPSRTTLSNTWGLAVWSPHFTDFLHDMVRTGRFDGKSVSHIFDTATNRGFTVNAIEFANDRYIDLGYSTGLRDLLIELGDDANGWPTPPLSCA